MNKLVVVLIALALSCIVGCGDMWNMFSRKKMENFDGDYKVTTFDDSFVREWEVKDGKVTSEVEKGYYYFWAIDPNDEDEELYIQTPMNKTIIEEM